MEITELLGRNLRAHRLRRQLSQEDLAAASGIHRTYISGLERGVRNPSVIIVARLADASRQSPTGLQELGNSIIKFCNDHARASLERYELNQIGYARIILHRDGRATYFERALCSRDSPDIFNPDDFSWRWSEPKTTVKKEQLPALHGLHIATEQKWWAWHGLGENQLHFSGESVWWPPEDGPNSFSFRMPSADARLSFDQFIDLFDG